MLLDCCCIGDLSKIAYIRGKRNTQGMRIDTAILGETHVHVDAAARETKVKCNGYLIKIALNVNKVG